MEQLDLRVFGTIGGRAISNIRLIEEYKTKLLNSGFEGNVKVLVLSQISEDTECLLVNGIYKPFSKKESCYVLANHNMNKSSIDELETWSYARPSSQFYNGDNAYQRWYEEDDDRLREMFLSGIGINELSVKFERSRGAIKSRLKLLQLITNK